MVTRSFLMISNSTTIHSLWSCLLPGCSLSIKGLSWRAMLRTDLLRRGVWPSRPPGTGVVQWLFTAPMPLDNKAACYSGWKKPKVLPFSSGEMRFFLFNWSRPFSEDMVMAVEEVRDDKGYHQGSWRHCMAMFLQVGKAFLCRWHTAYCFCILNF